MLCECCIAITYVGMCIWQSLKQLKAGCLIPAWEKKKKGGEERKKRREKGERGEASSGDCWVLCPTGLSVRKLSGLVQLILIWSEMFSTSRHVYFPPSQNINFKTHVSHEHNWFHWLCQRELISGNESVVLIVLIQRAIQQSVWGLSRRFVSEQWETMPLLAVLLSLSTF